MVYDNKKIVWVAWERHRRTLELCKYLQISPEIYDKNLFRPIKHTIFSIKTILYLHKIRPKVVIVQNPSIILAIIASLMKMILPYKLVVDAHNVAILPEKYKTLCNLLNIVIYKMSDLIIVTNEALAKKVASNNGKPFILPDRLPSFQLANKGMDHIEDFLVVCICTYNEDEPYEEMILVASELSKSHIKFVFTGNYKKLDRKLLLKSYNHIEFPGYLQEKDYITLLASANLIVDLTKRENCLVCGAYEAVACGVPLVLSNYETLRTYFHKGVVYTENTKDGIKSAIRYAIENHKKLKSQILELKDEINADWEIIGCKFLINLIKGEFNNIGGS